jgi:hypothetical protein
MKIKVDAFVTSSSVALALIIGFVIVRPVLAQVAATSTNTTAASMSAVDTIASSTPTDASSTPVVEDVSASTTSDQAAPTNATLSDSSAMKLFMSSALN